MVVSPPPPPKYGIVLATPVASTCGVIAAWYTVARGGTVSYSTRSIAFDGTLQSDVFAHPALSVEEIGSENMTLAVNSDGSIGALLVDTAGCRFVPLDANGAERGDVVGYAYYGCRKFAASADGFSLFVQSAQTGAMADLVGLDARGMRRTSATLYGRAGHQVWDRLVFDDGSFLLHSLLLDPITYRRSHWVQHFDTAGAALSSDFELKGVDASVLFLAPSATGALAAWSSLANSLVPLDRDGRTTGPIQMVPTKERVYEMSLVAVPNGDVLLVWQESDITRHSDFFVQAFAPNGQPRGAATLLKQQMPNLGYFGAVVESSGDRALVVFTATGEGGGARATPLRCVR